jgi:predicted DNA-binding transcriptional regulator AlpA
MDSRYLCLKDLATRLGLAPRSVRRWVKALKVPPDVKAGADLWAESTIDKVLMPRWKKVQRRRLRYVKKPVQNPSLA